MSRRTENQLLDDVEALGWTGLRAPASGSRQASEVGDLWIGREYDLSPIGPLAFAALVREHGMIPPTSEMYMVEEKYRSQGDDPYIREDGDKLDKMIDSARAFGAIPLISVRWSTANDWGSEWTPDATHYHLRATEVPRTGGNNVSLKPDQVREWDDTGRFFGE